MPIARRTLALSLLAAPALAQAPWAPSRPLRLIVPFAPGGSTDVGGRIMAERMGETLGQPVAVENRSGAGGAVGLEAAARAAPDGHTIVVGTTGLSIAPHLGLLRGVDVQRDLAAVSLIFTTDLLLLVHPSVPARNMTEFVAHVRANPGRLSYGTSGVGTGTHIFTEKLMSVAGIRMEHVPYRGSGQAMADLVSGTIQVMLDQPASSIAQVRQGLIRAVGASGPRRNPLVPDLMTFTEAGLAEATAQSWGSIMAPAGTPRPAIERLNTAVREALAHPPVVARMAAAGLDAQGSTPEEMDAYLADQLRRWGSVIRERGIRVE
jgi:tripartite-type tricarboxylate transporter receptor subunit TctC